MKRILLRFSNLQCASTFLYMMLHTDIFINLEIWLSFEFQISIYLKEYLFYLGGVYKECIFILFRKLNSTESITKCRLCPKNEWLKVYRGYNLSRNYSERFIDWNDHESSQNFCQRPSEPGDKIFIKTADLGDDATEWAADITFKAGDKV